MTPTQFRNALRHLRLDQTEMARLLGEEPRTIRRWIAGDTRIPRGTVMIIRALLVGDLTKKQIEQLRD